MIKLGEILHNGDTIKIIDTAQIGIVGLGLQHDKLNVPTSSLHTALMHRGFLYHREDFYSLNINTTTESIKKLEHKWNDYYIKLFAYTVEKVIRCRMLLVEKIRQNV